jgi:hypothetical protein
MKLFAFVVCIVLFCVAPLLFMFCWNYVAPLFWGTAPQLDFIQALAIVVMARIIFGGNPIGVETE